MSAHDDEATIERCAKLMDAHARVAAEGLTPASECTVWRDAAANLRAAKNLGLDECISRLTNDMARSPAPQAFYIEGGEYGQRGVGWKP